MTKLRRRIALALGAGAFLLLSSFGAASVKARLRLGKHYSTHRMALPEPARADAAAIERGRHLVTARYGCVACHGRDLAGGVMLDEPAIGTLRGPNLTRGEGSRTLSYDMADWDRIVRHGVKPDGTPALMPADDFFEMSDAELSDVVAYVRSVPAVSSVVPAPELGPIGKLLVAFGKFPLSAEHQPPGPHLGAPPEAADNVAFGEHLAATCTTCHRQNLAGGPMTFGSPDWPPARNLTPHASGLAAWSYQDFERALTLGVSKDGRRLKPPMADVVEGTKAMEPLERRALWTYLQSLAAAPTNG